MCLKDCWRVLVHYPVSPFSVYAQATVGKLDDDDYDSALKLVELGTKVLLQEGMNKTNSDLMSAPRLRGYFGKIATKFPQHLGRSIASLEANISASSSSARTPLQIAPHRKGFTLLHYAAVLGVPQFVEWLLGHKHVDSKKTSSAGWTVLHALTLAPYGHHRQADDHMTTAIHFINLGIDPLQKNDDGATAIDLAVQNGAYNVLYAILKTAKLDNVQELANNLLDTFADQGNTELAGAALKDLGLLLPLLKELGADFNIPRAIPVAQQPTLTGSSSGPDPLASSQSDKSKKKARPNDNCPCESGTKYKKCCGLKK